MTIYVGLNKEVYGKLKKGIYEPGIDDKGIEKLEGIKLWNMAITTAYNKYNSTSFNDFIFGCSDIKLLPPYTDIYTVDIPLLRRFIFPIYESDLKQIWLERNECTFDETVNKLINANKVLEEIECGKFEYVYIIPYIKSTWVKEKIHGGVVHDN